MFYISIDSEGEYRIQSENGNVCDSEDHGRIWSIR